MRLFKKLICKLFGHTFSLACEECEKVRCVTCGEWFDIEDAWGKWV